MIKMNRIVLLPASFFSCLIRLVPRLEVLYNHNSILSSSLLMLFFDNNFRELEPAIKVITVIKVILLCVKKIWIKMLISASPAWTNNEKIRTLLLSLRCHHAAIIAGWYLGQYLYMLNNWRNKLTLYGIRIVRLYH